MGDTTSAPVRVVLATPHPRHDRLESALRAHPALDTTRVRTPQELNAQRLHEIAPTFVFLPHWSWLIPESVFESFECVVFHMTDLPFGRGGSPLQNLIARGIYETRLTALRCEKELDAGPIYAQRPLSLHGGAEEILLRATELIGELIVEIVERRPVPHPQIGEPTLFRRRRPEEGNLAPLVGLEQVHDYIRMLDADGYPNAFLRVGRLRLEFARSRLAHDHVAADVRIRIVPDEETP